jgi:hypothetical protein
MVPVPLYAAFTAVPRNPSVGPDPDTDTVCDAVITLSAVPAATSGQVNVTPSEVTVPPGMIPALASAWAE